MNFRYFRRINFGKGLGLNRGKTSQSVSYRSKYGSIGSKGFSIRTGIVGLSFVHRFGKRKNLESILIYLLLLLSIGVVLLLLLVLWNVIRFLLWVIHEGALAIIHKVRSIRMDAKINRMDAKINRHKQESVVSMLKLTKELIPEGYRDMEPIFVKPLVKEGEHVEGGVGLASIALGVRTLTITADQPCKAFFYKLAGERLAYGDYLLGVMPIDSPSDASSL